MGSVKHLSAWTFALTPLLLLWLVTPPAALAAESLAYGMSGVGPA